MAAEYVAELREDVLHREAAAAETAKAAARRAAVHARVAELVVTRTLVGIRQHVVGLGGLLELFLGLLVARVLVGVIFYRGLAVGLLYLVGIGVALDAQHLIIIPFLCHCLNPFLK